MRHDMWCVRYTGKQTFIRSFVRSYVRSLISLQISLLAIHAHPCLKLCSDFSLYPVLSQMWVTRALRGCFLGGRQLLFCFVSKRRKATNAVGMSFFISYLQAISNNSHWMNGRERSRQTSAKETKAQTQAREPNKHSFGNIQSNY